MKEQDIQKATHIASLIVKRMQGALTGAEREELEAWIHESSENYLLYEELMDQEQLGNALDEMQSFDNKAAYQRLSSQVFRSRPVLKRISTKVWYFTAAAVLLLIAGSIVFYDIWPGDPAPTAPGPLVQLQEPRNIQPGSQKALLTYSNGTTIPLDRAANGFFDRVGYCNLYKMPDGSLLYLTAPYDSWQLDTQPSAGQYHTISVPRGGEYQVILPDGSVVWLNAASSLRFPPCFTGKERRMELTGEAYFKVHKDKTRPFIVQAGDLEIKALGTEFNITAYADENIIQATLVKGLAQVSRNNKKHLLQPGRKAVATPTSIAIKEADLQQATGWKNGEFVFHNTPLRSIMKQLQRWYDVEVSYDPGMPEIRFTGELKREDDIKRLLMLIELTDEVRFTVNGKNIFVAPYH